MKKLQEITDSISEKLTKEESAKIVDDIADILTFAKTNNDDIINKDNEIEKLKQEKENLITVNGNLLQKIPKEEDTGEKDPKEVNKRFDFRSIFEKGKFKR